jgi:hypothetical protein
MLMMKKLPGMSKQAGDQKLSKWDWIGGSKRVAVLPVPVVIARHRLKTGFVPDCIVSQGLFNPTYKYQAHINDAEIDVQFTVLNKSVIDYEMYGKLSPHPTGSTIEIKTKTGISVYIMAAIFLVLLFIVKPSGLFVSSILVIAVVYFIGLMWHRKIAADKVSELMQNLVSGHFVNNGSPNGY